MLQSYKDKRKNRLVFDNSWWQKGGGINADIINWPRREYFKAFLNRVRAPTTGAPILLVGARQTGKTVMIKQAIYQLLRGRVKPSRLFYISVANPVLAACSLAEIVEMYLGVFGFDANAKGHYVFIDDAHYRPDWPEQVSALAKAYPGIRFVAAGSVMVVPKKVDPASTWDRSTEFLLPPLTFVEFLRLRGSDKNISDLTAAEFDMGEIDVLNREFMTYLNHGGFPETAYVDPQKGSRRIFNGNDLVQKMVLSDVPDVYGIGNIADLNHLFSVLAYNSGAEVTFEELVTATGLAKNTIRKFLDFLEAAFLIYRVKRVDQHAKQLKRTRSFKVYVTHLTIRSALFGPLINADMVTPAFAETMFFAQYLHAGVLDELFFARWDKGEVGLAFVDEESQSPWDTCEITFDDGIAGSEEALTPIAEFSRLHGLSDIIVSTRATSTQGEVDGISMLFEPLAAMCLRVNATSGAPDENA